jgi:hypothetical protein
MMTQNNVFKAEFEAANHNPYPSANIIKLTNQRG